MRPIAHHFAVLAVTLPAIACRASEAAPEWLQARAQQEARLAASSPALHDFRFTDQRQASGITFKNRIVVDAGKTYKLVHYDHGSGLCAADVDGDGKPDLYFMTQLGTNQLWRNTGSDKFEDITAAAGLTMPDEIAVGCAFADIDNDGDPDLFVTTVRHGNRLFENTGHGMFRDITAAAGVGYVGHSAGAVFFDYDRDGLLDLFVTNVGVFTSNTRGPGGYYVGLSDAFLGHLHPERAEASILYHNLGGNRFKNVTREVGLVDLSWSGDAVLLDANGDGFPRHHVNFLAVRLRGTRSTREGLGAEVTVVVPDGRRILKLFDGKSGYLSQSDLPLYFGLGDADSAAEIEVRWPSGELQPLPGPKAGHTIEVVEP